MPQWMRDGLAGFARNDLNALSELIPGARIGCIKYHCRASCGSPPKRQTLFQQTWLRSGREDSFL